jgi:hypothetical protein
MNENGMILEEKAHKYGLAEYVASDGLERSG